MTRAVPTAEQNEQLARELTVNGTQYTAAQIGVLRSTIAKNATNDELRLFIAVCGRTGLDPFSRQIYFVKYGDQGSIQTGIDGFRAISERSGQYAGMDPPEWCGEDGEWVNLWTRSDPPFAARVTIYRKDWTRPIIATARWSAYSQTNKMWQRFGVEMLAKCAESLARRQAFANDLSGPYTVDEMRQAEESRDPRRNGLQGRGAAAPESAASVVEELVDEVAAAAKLRPRTRISPRWSSSEKEFEAACNKAKSVPELALP
jgi:phage recombination protein Bet